MIGEGNFFLIRMPIEEELKESEMHLYACDNVISVGHFLSVNSFRTIRKWYRAIFTITI